MRPGSPTLRRSIVAKFDWLERAETAALRAQWNAMFRDIRPVTLAPSLGRVQAGPDLAQQVIDLYYCAVFDTPNADVMDLHEATGI